MLKCSESDSTSRSVWDEREARHDNNGTLTTLNTYPLAENFQLQADIRPLGFGVGILTGVPINDVVEERYVTSDNGDKKLNFDVKNTKNEEAFTDIKTADVKVFNGHLFAFYYVNNSTKDPIFISGSVKAAELSDAPIYTLYPDTANMVMYPGYKIEG